MNRTDLATALLFGFLGILIWFEAVRFPAGVAGLPGPGFFPETIGAIMLGLAALLAVRSLRSGASPIAIENRKALAVAVILVGLYLLLWSYIDFAPRTAVFLVCLLRLLGEGWRSSVTVAAVLTATVIAAFQMGLNVTLQ